MFPNRKGCERPNQGRGAKLCGGDSVEPFQRVGSLFGKFLKVNKKAVPHLRRSGCFSRTQACRPGLSCAAPMALVGGWDDRTSRLGLFAAMKTNRGKIQEASQSRRPRGARNGRRYDGNSKAKSKACPPGKAVATEVKSNGKTADREAPASGVAGAQEARATVAAAKANATSKTLRGMPAEACARGSNGELISSRLPGAPQVDRRHLRAA